MARSIRDYVSEGVNPSYAQLKERFGTPSQVAAAYVGEMETDELLRNMKISSRVIGIVAVTAAILIAMWAGVISAELIKHEKQINGYAIVTTVNLSTGETIDQEVYR